MRRRIDSLVGFLGTGAATAAILCVGLSIRLILLAFVSRTPIVSDARSYLTMASQLSGGEDFVPYWPPGLPYYLALFCRIGACNDLVARAAMLGFFGLFALVLYRLVRMLSTRWAANLALLLFAVYPSYIHLSVETMTELPAAALVLSAVYLALRSIRDRSWRWPALLGLALGWLVLVRPSSLLLVAMLPGFVWIRCRRLSFAMLSVVIAAGLVSMWLVKAERMNGSFVMVNTANARNLFFGNNPYTPLYRTWWFGSHSEGEPGVPEAYSAMCAEIQQQPVAERSSLYREAAMHHILSRPDLFLLRSLNRLRNYFAFDTYTGSVLIKTYGLPKVLGLAVIGFDAFLFVSIVCLAIAFLFAGGETSILSRETGLIVAAVLAYALPYWIAFSHPRLHFPVVPLLGVLAAMMANKLFGLSAREVLEGIKRSRRRYYGLIVSLLVLAYIQIEWILMMRSRI